jgi:Hsp20/alpha crystallin family protein
MQRQMSEKTTDCSLRRRNGAMTEDCYGISVELPGVAVGDLQIITQDGTLTIQGEKRLDHPESGRTYFFSERNYGAFQRSFRLPPDAAADRIGVFSRLRFRNFSRQRGTAGGSPFVLNDARGPATTRQLT